MHGCSSIEKADSSPSTNVYSSYEELPDLFKESTNFESLFTEIYNQTSEDSNWRVQFDILENLRILNKYHPQKEELKVVDFITKLIIQAMQNPNKTFVRGFLLICEGSEIKGEV